MAATISNDMVMALLEKMAAMEAELKALKAEKLVAEPVAETKAVVPAKSLCQLLQTGEIHVAKAFAAEFKADIKTQGIDGKDVAMVWNDNARLFVAVGNAELNTIITEWIEQELDKEEAEETDKATRREIGKLAKAYGKGQNVKSITEQARVYLMDNGFFKTLNRQKGVWHFANGVVDLKTGVFRKREKTDYCSVYTGYERLADSMIPKNYIKKIEEWFDQMFGPYAEYVKDYLGYMMTGEANLQICLYLLGVSSGNGKTSLLIALAYVCGTHLFKNLRNTAFADTPTADRCWNGCECVRGVSCDEPKGAISQEEFKNFTAGEGVFKTQLYSQDVMMGEGCVGLFASNHTARLAVEPAILRRVRMVPVISKYVKECDLDKPAYKKKGVKLYVRDDTLSTNIKNDTLWRNAFASVLIKHAKRFYERGRKLDEKIDSEIQNFTETQMGDVDPLQSFINDMLMETGDEKDRIGRLRFLAAYKAYSKDDKMTWDKLQPKAAGIIAYDPQKRADKLKGCFFGYKLKTDLQLAGEEESDSEDDNEVEIDLQESSVAKKIIDDMAASDDEDADSCEKQEEQMKKQDFYGIQVEFDDDEITKNANAIELPDW
jgi:phage/plasmid-associated DNA primase